MVDRYHEHGYSILAITDHNEVTWPWTAFAEMEASGTSQNRMESATETMPERPVWGYSNDDMHTEPHIGRNWNMLILPELSHDWVRTGMVEGLSYFVYVPGGHNGPEAPVIESVRVNNRKGTIEITGSGYNSVVWIHAGEVVHQGNKIDLNGLPEPVNYIRAKLYGPGETVAGTQPFGIKKP